MEQLFTKKQIAEILSIEEITVTRWIRSGKLPHIRLNGTSEIRVTEGQLQEWMNKRKEASNKEAASYSRRRKTEKASYVQLHNNSINKTVEEPAEVFLHRSVRELLNKKQGE